MRQILPLRSLAPYLPPRSSRSRSHPQLDIDPMQVTGGDSWVSGLSRSAAHEPNAPGRKARPSGISALPPDATHRLRQRRLDALEGIDEGSFSCVASLSRLSLD